MIVSKADDSLSFSCIVGQRVQELLYFLINYLLFKCQTSNHACDTFTCNVIHKFKRSFWVKTWGSGCPNIRHGVTWMSLRILCCIVKVYMLQKWTQRWWCIKNILFQSKNEAVDDDDESMKDILACLAERYVFFYFCISAV